MPKRQKNSGSAPVKASKKDSGSAPVKASKKSLKKGQKKSENSLSASVKASKKSLKRAKHVPDGLGPRGQRQKKRGEMP